MHEVLRLPIGALPNLLFGCGLLLAALLSSIFMDGSGDLTRRATLRFMAASAVLSLAKAAWLAQSTLEASSEWYRLVVPLTALAQLAALEAIIKLTSLRVPRWYWLLYGLVGVGLALGLMGGWRPLLAESPNGYWMRPIGPWGARWWLPAIEGAGAFAMLAMLVRRMTRHVDAPSISLAAAVLGTVAVNFNDSIWAVGHATFFPLGWLGAAFFTMALMTAVRVKRDSRDIEKDGNAGTVLDRLTGIEFGRRALLKGPAGVLYIYLDGFSEMHDAYGALTGGAILDRVSAELGSICRQGDRVVRLTNGEFLMILADIPFQHARSVRERVDQMVRQTALYVNGRPASVAIEAAVGWAWGERGASFAHVVEEARRVMREDQARRKRALDIRP